MLNHRRMLLEDYQLSPDLVVACGPEIKRMCGGGKEVGGRTLHCLMKYARQHSKTIDSGNARVSRQCKKQVSCSLRHACDTGSIEGGLGTG